MIAFSAKSIHRAKKEMSRIVTMFKENMTVQRLEGMVSSGQSLPQVVMIKGTLAADGACITAMSPGIEGLQSRIGTIKQPENSLLEFGRLALDKKGPLSKFTAMFASKTKISPNDIEDQEDTYSERKTTLEKRDSLILAECLVSRIFGHASKQEKEDNDGNKTGDVKITRSCKQSMYTVLQHRRAADGLHLVCNTGSKAYLELPSCGAEFPEKMQEPPPLFLPMNDPWCEFCRYFNKQGPEDGKAKKLSDETFGKNAFGENGKIKILAFPDPYIFVSKNIFIDVMSHKDLGDFHDGHSFIEDLGQEIGAGKSSFLWEPRAFYDMGSHDDLQCGDWNGFPPYARDTQTEMVSANELITRAQAAAQENSRETTLCEPTFARNDLLPRRDQENCFRFTELAIPSGEKVTILGKPIIQPETGGVKLVPPDDAMDGGDKDLAEAERYRFRILRGHTVENLLVQRRLSIIAYYGMGVLGCVIITATAIG